jgi:hypothetical protein
LVALKIKWMIDYRIMVIALCPRVAVNFYLYFSKIMNPSRIIVIKDL